MAQENLVAVLVTQAELDDLRIAMMDYAAKWLDYRQQCIEGIAPRNMSTEGCRLVYDDVVQLQQKLKAVHEAVGGTI